MFYMEEPKRCTVILAAAFRVHSRLGPGLLESVYQRVFAYEPLCETHRAPRDRTPSRFERFLARQAMGQMRAAAYTA